MVPTWCPTVHCCVGGGSSKRWVMTWGMMTGTRDQVCQLILLAWVAWVHSWLFLFKSDVEPQGPSHHSELISTNMRVSSRVKTDQNWSNKTKQFRLRHSAFRELRDSLKYIELKRRSKRAEIEARSQKVLESSRKVIILLKWQTDGLTDTATPWAHVGAKNC